MKIKINFPLYKLSEYIENKNLDKDFNILNIDLTVKIHIIEYNKIINAKAIFYYL